MCCLPYKKETYRMIYRPNNLNDSYYSSPCGRLWFASNKYKGERTRMDNIPEHIKVNDAFRLNITFVEFFLGNDCQYNSLTLIPSGHIEAVCGWRQSWSDYVIASRVQLLYKPTDKPSDNFVSILYDVSEDGEGKSVADHEIFIMYKYNISLQLNFDTFAASQDSGVRQRRAYIRSHLHHQIYIQVPFVDPPVPRSGEILYRFARRAKYPWKFS